MIAFLLSAGLGTRLRPLTDDKPKCLITINEKTLLEIWIEKLIKLNIKKIFINSHYQHKKLQKFIKNSEYKKYIHILYEENLLGSSGSLYNFFLNYNENILVAHSDNFTTDDLTEFFEYFKNKPKYCIGTMLVYTTEYPKECGIVDINKNNILKNMYEKVSNPPSNLANGACYIFDKKVLTSKFLNKKSKDISIDLIPKLYNLINIYKTNHFYEDIGTIERLTRTEKYVETWNNSTKL